MKTTDSGLRRAPAELRHRELRALVRRIRRETRRAVPHFDPHGPGTLGRVLILLSDPGGSEGGALRTGYVSPWLNNDATAQNERRLIDAAGLPRGICVFWNAMPWDLNGRKPTSSDRRRGAVYLSALLERLPRLRAVVACGADAHLVCALADIEDVLQTCHPGNRGLNGGVKNARAAREADFIKQLRSAARRAHGPLVGRRRAS